MKRSGPTAGCNVYIPYDALAAVFPNGEVPETLYYRAIEWDKKSIIIRVSDHA